MPREGMRDRIVELRRMRAGDLAENPRNWRRHPDRQRRALRAMLEEVGFADAILVRERADGVLEIIDGHLRKSMDPEMVVPVLLLDVDEAEGDKLLASLDPLASLAVAVPEPLADLFASMYTRSEDLRVLLAKIATEAGAKAKLGRSDPDENEHGSRFFSIDPDELGARGEVTNVVVSWLHTRRSLTTALGTFEHVVSATATPLRAGYFTTSIDDAGADDHHAGATAHRCACYPRRDTGTAHDGRTWEGVASETRPPAEPGVSCEP